ncbi:MAG: SagB/ThcOx family dehydrogenase [Phycisphaerales bacterium]|nr:MAG: SagB/ThcOx family dehydrogenase [Phycisphaerales bacterium]
MDPLAQVIAYHERTKHDFHRGARSPGYLDWANQPDPFRRFEGSPLFELPLGPDDGPPDWEALFRPGLIPPAPVDRDSLGRFFYLSMAVSAWKEYQGSRWALRCNPSSGNLHPTEAYLLIGAARGLSDSAALYHYAPQAHGLELRATIDAAAWAAFPAAAAGDAFVVALTSVHWREAWKYGERAYRYCQHDAGHAVGALRFAAACLGWNAAVLSRPSDDDLNAVLGTDREGDFFADEPEAADLMMIVNPTGPARHDVDLPPEFVRGMRNAGWIGKANRLSSQTVRWDAIDIVHQFCRKPRGDGFGTPPTAAEPTATADDVPSTHPRGRPNAAVTSAPAIIRVRRSAVAYDGRTTIPGDRFFHVLQRTVPGPGKLPFDALGPPYLIDLLLFVHRVEGVTPGLHILVREGTRLGPLRAALDARRSTAFLGISTLQHGRPDEFEWVQPDGCPLDLPLYRLRSAGCTALASQLSCTQDIAGDGCFSVGMLATFHDSLLKYGPWIYRRLFWETGLIGQLLYLEAEAAGIRATGIGCYFDDPVHQTFGLEGIAYQSLYHFTMGGAVEDTRLTTLPAYGRRGRA